MKENPKSFQAAVKSALAEQNLQEISILRSLLRSNDHDDSKGKTEEPIEIDHKTSEKMFPMS